MTRPTPVIRDSVVPTAMPSGGPGQATSAAAGGGREPVDLDLGLAHAGPAGTGGTGDRDRPPSPSARAPGAAPDASATFAATRPPGRPPRRARGRCPPPRWRWTARSTWPLDSGQAAGGGVEGDVHLEEARGPGLHVEVEGVGDAGQHGDPLGLSVGEEQLVAGEGQGAGHRVGRAGDDGDRDPCPAGR